MIIFSPGPSNISERVRAALTLPDICHRDEEFRTLLHDIRAAILDLAGVRSPEFRSVVFTGSGSVAIESAVAAARPLGRMLVVSNGAYGERASAMGRYHGVEVVEWQLEWGQEVDPEQLATQIDETRPRSVYIVHHETSTGRLNDLATLAPVIKRRDCLLLVDGISSLGGEPLDVGSWGIDALMGSANKCLRGIPGVSFLVASQAFLDVAGQQRAAHYGNLWSHLEAEEVGETPYTPALQAFFALREALSEVIEEGVDQRIRHYRELSQHMMTGLRDLGLELVLPPEAYGHTLLSYDLPDGFDFVRLHDSLKRKGYVIYDAQGSLKGKVFRLGLVGHFGMSEVDGFLAALTQVLRKG